MSLLGAFFGIIVLGLLFIGLFFPTARSDHVFRRNIIAATAILSLWLPAAAFSQNALRYGSPGELNQVSAAAWLVLLCFLFICLWVKGVVAKVGGVAAFLGLLGMVIDIAFLNGEKLIRPMFAPTATYGALDWIIVYVAIFLAAIVLVLFLSRSIPNPTPRPTPDQPASPS